MKLFIRVLKVGDEDRVSEYVPVELEKMDESRTGFEIRGEEIYNPYFQQADTEALMAALPTGRIAGIFHFEEDNAVTLTCLGSKPAVPKNGDWKTTCDFVTNKETRDSRWIIQGDRIKYELQLVFTGGIPAVLFSAAKQDGKFMEDIVREIANDLMLKDVIIADDETIIGELKRNSNDRMVAQLRDIAEEQMWLIKLAKLTAGETLAGKLIGPTRLFNGHESSLARISIADPYVYVLLHEERELITIDCATGSVQREAEMDTDAPYTDLGADDGALSLRYDSNGDLAHIHFVGEDVLFTVEVRPYHIRAWQPDVVSELIDYAWAGCVWRCTEVGMTTHPQIGPGWILLDDSNTHSAVIAEENMDMFTTTGCARVIIPHGLGSKPDIIKIRPGTGVNFHDAPVRNKDGL